jgi:hypothetical protein
MTDAHIPGKTEENHKNLSDDNGFPVGVYSCVPYNLY